MTRTYAELDEVTDRTAAGFAELGLDPGEHVSLMMLNSIENVDAWFGLQKAGLVEIPIHTASRGTALQYIVDHADARALVWTRRSSRISPPSRTGCRSSST